MNIKSKIAQIIIDMDILERIPIKKPEMVDIIKEVNESKMIGNAIYIKYDIDKKPVYIKKYRRTYIEDKIY